MREHGTVSVENHARLIYDMGAAKVLLVSGRPNRGVFAWDGREWSYVAEPANELFMQGAAYDEARERVVLFGGLEADHVGAGSSSTTALFDGATWQALMARGPAAGGGAVLVYDAARERVVLTGGGAYTNAKPRTETWLFDGKAWANAAPAESPGSQYAGAAYDRARELVVLVRPIDGNASETWEWDGETWQHVAAATPLPYVYQYALAYDAVRERIVSLVAGALWAWDGNTWARVDSDDGRDSERGTSPIAYDVARSRLVAHRPYKSTWEHDGSTWHEVRPTKPAARTGAASIYDSARKRSVYFGGVTEADDATWEWNGTAWSRGPSAASATPTGLSMAYDSKRERAVLVVDGKTWEYDGESWSEVALAPGNVGLIAYDAARGVSVALIGSATWTWDGASWRNTMAAGPTVVRDSAMAYDAARERIVRFGGYTDGTGSSQIDETWEWNGSAWTRMTPAASPSARGGHTLAFDSRRERVVLFGGYRHNEVWEYDGDTWTQRKTPSTPPGSFSNGMVYAPDRDRMVFFASTGTLWEYYPVGESCSASAQCPSGYCVAGICCDRACSNTRCEACSVDSGASADGICELTSDAGALCVSSVPDGGTTSDGGLPQRRRSSGCSAAPHGAEADGGGWLALVWLAVAASRRHARVSTWGGRRVAAAASRRRGTAR